MSTGPAEPRLPPSTARLVAGLVLVLSGSLAGCTEDPAPPPAPAPEVSGAVQEQIARTLRQRTRALTEDDERLFRRTLSGRDATFVDAQRTYFANLTQLPLAEASVRMEEATLVREGADYWSEVEVTLQLQGYDTQPVITRDRFRFSPARNGQRYLLSSTTDEQWEEAREVQRYPWDLGPIRVRRDNGVLGIFDPTTVEAADKVMDAASLGRFDVDEEVPGTEPGDVVVYATGELSYLEQLPGLPISDPQRVDAVTVPVLADASRAQSPVAAYRIAVNPRVLTEDQRLLDRLMRHELTHVAVGQRADGAPLWLSEGIAEWVSVQPIARDVRRLPAESLSLAQDGLSELPEDDAFSGSSARAWYGVAWWICEYVATTYDRTYLWELLERTSGDGDVGEAVEELLGITPAELVTSAMDLMRQQYAREPAPTAPPTASATPTPTPSSPQSPPGASPTPIEPRTSSSRLET